MIIDTHCHLGYEDYGNIEEIISNFDGNIMIASGVDLETNKEVIKLIEKYPNVYGTLGIHPEYALSKDLDMWINFIEENINNKKIVGIGEIGLDYHYEGYDKEKQKSLFVRLIELAKKYNKTIVVHTRDAIQDTFDIIRGTKANDVNVTIHCFSESLEMAKEFVKLGCKIGVGGVVTFKNGRKLREVVENLDISNFVLETDSPYLSPEPFRGSKNEPKNIFLVAEKIAEIKNITKEEVINKTTNNSLKQYNMEV